MVYIVSMSCFVKFGGQTSNNVQYVRKVYLEINLCVNASFVYFYIFFFDEIDVVGPKLVYEHVCVRNVRENITMDNLRVLYKGPMLAPKTSQDNPPIYRN